MSQTEEYLVTGAHPVLGREPGDTVPASDLTDPQQLDRLVRRGSLQPVVVPKPTAVLTEQDSGKEQD